MSAGGPFYLMDLRFMLKSFQSARSLVAALAAFAALALIPATFAQNKPAEQNKPTEQKYTAILIWGTDGEKPADKPLKDVDGKLTEKFRKIFKWKNYFEVSRDDVQLTTAERKNVKLSPKCDVKMHLNFKGELEVELHGEGKLVYHGVQSMPLKDLLILAGDDKNATAWFVVLKPQQ